MSGSVRNVFDQYSQPENRLSHALATSLYEDPVLVRKFVYWALGQRAPKGQLYVLEQSRPGELPADEEHTDRRGLPDLWIHNGEDWSLVIESKVKAQPVLAQLRAHQREVKRWGHQPNVLLLTARPARFPVPEDIHLRRWTELYVWLCEHRDTSYWASALTQYMESLERTWAAESYLLEGTLTEFAGIRWDPGAVWNYPEAKRQLKLVMDELRTRQRLEKRLNVDPKGKGRPAITDNAGRVWDLLPLRNADPGKPHTTYPHFNVAISKDTLETTLSIPNSMRSVFHKRLLGQDYGDFEALTRKTTNDLCAALRGTSGARPYLTLLQRRYPSQRSVPYRDAVLEMDLRTAIPRPGPKAKAVKLQPEWLRMVHEVLANRRSNLHLSIGAQFSLSECTAVRSRKLIGLIEEVWLACTPFLGVMEVNRPSAR